MAVIGIALSLSVGFFVWVSPGSVKRFTGVVTAISQYSITPKQELPSPTAGVVLSSTHFLRAGNLYQGRSRELGLGL